MNLICNLLPYPPFSICIIACKQFIYSASFEFSEVHRASIMDICLFLSCDLFLRESSYYDNLARMTFLSNILHKANKAMRGNRFFSNDLTFFHETGLPAPDQGQSSILKAFSKTWKLNSWKLRNRWSPPQVSFLRKRMQLKIE